MRPALSLPGRLLLATLLIPCLGFLPAAPALADPPISLELNKLAPLPGATAGCRVYFVISNPDTQPISELQLDLVLFDTGGIIARRVTLGVGPLPAEKTVVRLFDLAAIPCDSIGHILLNDVLACRIGNQAPAPSEQQRAACLDRISTSSRAKAPLTK